MATPRSAGLSYAGSGRGGEGGARAAGPFQNAPSQSCPPRAPAAVVQPKAEAARRQTGSPVQLWLLVSPVRLSPAAPPPSPETGWSNVSSEALGRPRSPLSPGGRRPQHRGLPGPRLFVHSALALGPSAPVLVPGPPRCLPPACRARCCASSRFSGNGEQTLAPPSPLIVLGSFEMNPQALWKLYGVTRLEAQEL